MIKKIVFERKFNLSTQKIIPQKAMVKKGTRELTDEWKDLLHLFPNGKVKMTIEWENKNP